MDIARLAAILGVPAPLVEAPSEADWARVEAELGTPLCGRRSRQVRSHYERTLADLPCGGDPSRSLFALVDMYIWHPVPHTCVCRAALGPVRWEGRR